MRPTEDLNDRLDVTKMTIKEVVETFSIGAAEYNEGKLIAKLEERERHLLATLGATSMQEYETRLKQVLGTCPSGRTHKPGYAYPTHCLNCGGEIGT